ncbi:MAG: hypothetical protein JWL96_2797 [Sphingomonas bacterium]|nr:hypothetical protein [Sphingomonas bacterium]
MVNPRHERGFPAKFKARETIFLSANPLLPLSALFDIAQLPAQLDFVHFDCAPTKRLRSTCP